MLSTRMTDPPPEFVTMLEASKRLNLTKMGIAYWRTRNPAASRWDTGARCWLISWQHISRDHLDDRLSIKHAAKRLGIPVRAVRTLVRTRPDLAQLVPGQGPTGRKYRVDVHELAKVFAARVTHVLAEEMPRPPPDRPPSRTRDVREVGNASR
jgi:hypothetical protein